VVEGFAKRMQLGYSPTSRSRYSANTATLFGQRRVRFPASGRRRKSFDSLLHAFVKKAGPSRLRRASFLRFKRIIANPGVTFHEALVVAGAHSGLNRRRKLAGALSRVAYLSRGWRELFGYRADVSEEASFAPGAPITKRRFGSLPTALIYKQNTSSQYCVPYKHQTRVIRTGILRRALRRRRLERVFVDLHEAAIHRRLPRERASLP